MANKNLFQSTSKSTPDTVNEAGGKAYSFSAKHSLAQLACAGCLNDTFYTTDEQQLKAVLELCKTVPAEFIAKTAIYARQRGLMKDMPALLLAILANKDLVLLKQVFNQVIDSPKMLRNFCQIVRSGVTGRKSFGSGPRKLVRDWLESRTDDQIFKGSIGNDPSLADVIKMVHPTPKTKSREALYGYLLGKEKVSKRSLPQLVKDFEAYKAGKTKEVPKVPFEMLTALELGTEEWTEIAKNSSWTQIRMNLNTFARHGVLQDKRAVKVLADRLRDPEEIKRAKAFPYQLMVAYMNASPDVPKELTSALQDAMEVAIENVPQIDGQVFVFPDVSGSMSSPATGNRGSATTKVRCIDVAALVAASFMRKNPNTVVLPFENHVVNVKLNERDSVMTNAEKLSRIGGGGTNCSAPLSLLNQSGSKSKEPVLVIYVSDNQSWIDSVFQQRSTATVQQWNRFKATHPNAKMVCIDIQANGTTQVKDDKNILNLGGFSDALFGIISDFASNRLNTSNEHWVKEIEKLSLDKE